MRKNASLKCRGQRISHAELVAESKQRFKECGVDCHQRALFINLLGGEVVGHPDRLFSQQQPRNPKSGGTSVAWTEAYALVVGFLRERGLVLTVDTVEHERPASLEAKSTLPLTLAQISRSASEASSGAGEGPLRGPRRKPGLTIIPPDRLPDTTIVSPTRHSPVGKEVIVPAPEDDGGKKRAKSPRLAPLQPASATAAKKKRRAGTRATGE
jgi:hypothetical protein